MFYQLLKQFKLVFFVCLLGISIFCFPSTSRAVVMELTVTINNFTIPQRSVLDYTLDRPSTQYLIGNARIGIIDKNDAFIATQDLFTPGDANNYASPSGDLTIGNFSTVGFVYNVLQAPYRAYIEIEGEPQGDNIGCTADCSPVPTYLEWFNIGYSSLRYWKRDEFNNLASTEQSMCGFPYCPGTDFHPYPDRPAYGTRGEPITVDKKYMVSQYDIDRKETRYWWRSPILYCIDSGESNSCSAY